MKRAITLKLLLIAIVLVLQLKAESQWVRPPLPPTPLCASQFALVNHACAMLPYTPIPPPSPPSPPSPTPAPPTPPAPPSPDGPDDNRHHSHHSHHHGHGRGHGRHEHRETPAEGDCCRWLKEVDDVCVCDLLVRLPPFLTRPVHNYTVIVDDTCNVTFECGSRWVQV